MPSLCSFLDEQLKPLPPTEPWSITLLGRSGFSRSAAFSLRFRLEQNVRLVRRICGEEVRNPLAQKLQHFVHLLVPSVAALAARHALVTLIWMAWVVRLPSQASAACRSAWMPCPFGGMHTGSGILDCEYDDDIPVRRRRGLPLEVDSKSCQCCTRPSKPALRQATQVRAASSMCFPCLQCNLTTSPCLDLALIAGHNLVIPHGSSQVAGEVVRGASFGSSGSLFSGWSFSAGSGD